MEPRKRERERERERHLPPSAPDSEGWPEKKGTSEAHKTQMRGIHSGMPSSGKRLPQAASPDSLVLPTEAARELPATALTWNDRQTFAKYPGCDVMCRADSDWFMGMRKKNKYVRTER